jgi:hypothetical protein
MTISNVPNLNADELSAYASANVTVLESFPCTTYHSFMSPLLYHVVHFTTGLHHTAVILHILFIATFNTNSVQSFNSSCTRAFFLTATAKHISGVSDNEIREGIIRMLKDDGWKDAAITPMINEIARRTTGMAETTEPPSSPPKVAQDAIVVIMT